MMTVSIIRTVQHGTMVAVCDRRQQYDYKYQVSVVDQYWNLRWLSTPSDLGAAQKRPHKFKTSPLRVELSIHMK
jgi:hypothetical protein